MSARESIELAGSVDFLESTFASAPVGLAVFDREARYLRVNAELAALHGLAADAHIGRRVHDVAPTAGAQVAALIERVWSTGEPVRDVELTTELPFGGAVRHILCGLYPVRNSAGDIIAVGAWSTDITERRRATELLRRRSDAQREANAALVASRLKLQMAVEAAGLVMAEIDYRTDENHISAELARLLEIGEAPMVVPRQAIFDRVHPEDRERYLQGVMAATNPAGTGHLAIDVRALLPSGTVRWMHICLQVTFAEVDGVMRPDRGICAARDVTSETVSGLRMRAAQRLAESVIEGAGALVYAKDRAGRFILSNQAWRGLHGLTPEQAHGARDVDVFGEEMATRLREHDEQVYATGEPLIVEEKGVIRGRTVTFRSSKFPLYDDTGRVYAVCGVSTDISDVIEADRRKDEFIATLAHELRNPLAPIRTGLEILKRTPELPQGATRTRDIMERQLTHMVRLVDDLLDVSRISRDKLDLRPERITLAQVVDHAVEASRPAVDAAGHQLVVDLPEGAVWLTGDLTRLAQVVSNLVHNAAKYTPPGGHVDVSGHVDGDAVVIRVRDNGVGIAAERMPHLFELFAQGNGTGYSAQGGLGIGLWLVKKLVELHGGTINVESDGPGRGSAFTVRLPRSAR